MYPVPRVHKYVFINEVQRLCQLGVLKKVNISEYIAPTLIQQKHGTVHFLSDFRKLNQQIRRKPFTITKIQDMMLNLEGFTHAPSLDLNMISYCIYLLHGEEHLCTIVLPWKKYEYRKLPMGICNRTDIFQEKISELFKGFDTVRLYIQDILVITKKYFKNHMNSLEKVLHKLKELELNLNAEKSFFGRT